MELEVELELQVELKVELEVELELDLDKAGHGGAPSDHQMLVELGQVGQLAAAKMMEWKVVGVCCLVCLQAVG